MTLSIERIIMGIGTALVSYIAPVQTMFICVFVFITIDFITGILASYKRAKSCNKRWYFESEKGWRTIYKLTFSLIAIFLVYMLQELIIPFWDLKLINIITGFICGVEFWSFLENAADISHHKAFLYLKHITKNKLNEVEPGLGDQIEKESKDGIEAKEKGVS